MLKKKILLADDDADDRGIFEQVLSGKQELELVAAVENGLEVIAYLEAVHDGQPLPDLIILDHNMPRMNGRQTLGYLKSAERYLHIPVIIYSTYSDEKLVSDCVGLGASLIASKPSGYEEYKAMVNRFLQLLSR